MQTFYSRPATLDYLGSLDQGLTFSMHALILCDDIAGLLRTLWKGVQIDEETLALDLARQVGPRGNYLAHRHTVSHCRENLWASRYFGPNMPLSGDGKADLDLFTRIDNDLKLVLGSHIPEPLDLGLVQQITDICHRFQMEFSA
jgi:trimethylamine:corrinoid methyltransferase-like protein